MKLVNQPKQKTFENNISQFFGADATQYSNSNFGRAPQQSPQIPKDSFTSNVQNFFAVEESNSSPQRSYNSYNILSRMPCKYQINDGHKVGVQPAAQSRFEADQLKSKKGYKEMSGFKAQSFNPNMHQNICNFFGEEAAPGYNQTKTSPNKSPFQPQNLYTDKLAELQEQRIRNERSIAQSRLMQMNQMPQKNFFEFESQNSSEKQKERCYKNVRGLDVEAGDVYNPMTGKWMKVQRSYQQ